MTIPFWAVLYIIMLLGLDAWDAFSMRRRGKGVIAIAHRRSLRGRLLATIMAPAAAFGMLAGLRAW